MDVMDAVFRRRAVRAFKSYEINQDSLRFLAKAAGMAPSAMNQQPWALLILRDRSLIERVSVAACAYMLKRHAKELTKELLSSLKKGGNLFHGAPAVIVVCATVGGTQAAEDCALAAQNIMITACEYELGTCPIGLAREWMVSEEGRALLQIPAEWTPVIPIAIGQIETQPEAPVRCGITIQWVDAKAPSIGGAAGETEIVRETVK